MREMTPPEKVTVLEYSAKPSTLAYLKPFTLEQDKEMI
jgi:hypothetical protein